MTSSSACGGPASMGSSTLDAGPVLLPVGVPLHHDSSLWPGLVRPRATRPPTFGPVTCGDVYTRRKSWNRRRPVTGCRARQPPRRRACVRRTRRRLPPPATARPSGRPPAAYGGHPGRSLPSAARVRPCCSRPGPSGPARRRCAFEAVEKIVTASRGAGRICRGRHAWHRGASSPFP